MRDTDRFLLASGLIVTKSKASPAAKAFERTKQGHAYTDFRDDSDCGAAVNARDRATEPPSN